MVGTLTLPRGGGWSLFGIAVSALAWSTGVLWAHGTALSDLGMGWGRIAVVVTAGGFAQIVIGWIGFTAVAWAMLRVFGPAVPLRRLFTLLPAATPPLWLALPAAALWAADMTGQPYVAAFATCGFALAFLGGVARMLSVETNAAALRCIWPLGATVVFLMSVVSLTTQS